MSVWVGTLIAAGSTTTTPDPAKVLRGSVHPLLHTLLGLWPLWSLVLLAGAGRLLLDLRRLRRLRRAGIFEIDRMTGHEFEHKLALMFRSLGYRAEIVGIAGGDFGGDLVVSRNGTRTVVQAKCWRKKNVGVKAVQEAVAAKAMYRADDAMVVTNSRFTRQAQQLAGKNGVKLWGREELTVALLKGQKTKITPGIANDAPLDSPPSVQVAAPASETATVTQPAPTAVSSPSGAFCARCGEAVSVKVRDFCQADPERFGGLVYCFNDQRDFKRRGP